MTFRRSIAAALAAASLAAAGCGQVGRAGGPAAAGSSAKEPPFRIAVVDPSAAAPSGGPGATAEGAASAGASAAAGAADSPLALLEDPVYERHSLPDGPGPRSERLAGLLSEAASNPRLRALVVCPAIPGTAEAFRKVRAARPDLLLLAGESEEEPLLIQSAADLVAGADSAASGYLAAETARRLGASTLVLLAEPGEPSPARRLKRAAAAAACGELGLGFRLVELPAKGDRVQAVEAAVAEAAAGGPTGGLAGGPASAPGGDATGGLAGAAGAAGSSAGARNGGPGSGGKPAAFALESADLAETLLRALASKGGVFVGGEASAPYRGFPAAFPPARPALGRSTVLNSVDAAVVGAGLAGRFSTWIHPSRESFGAGLALLARGAVEGSARLDSLDDLVAALGRAAPGSYWRAAYYPDPATGIASRNQVLAYPDSYVFGKGYLSLTKVEIPERWRSLE